MVKQDAPELLIVTQMTDTLLTQRAKGENISLASRTWVVTIFK